MSRNRFAVIAAAVAVSLFASSFTARSQSQGLLSLKAISLDIAQSMVQAAIAKCRSDNYRISVHVLDGDGQVKASARDDGSSEVNYDVSRRKAYTALTYAMPSADYGKRAAERDRILDTGVHPLSARWAVDVRRVSGETIRST